MQMWSWQWQPEFLQSMWVLPICCGLGKLTERALYHGLVDAGDKSELSHASRGSLLLLKARGCRLAGRVCQLPCGCCLRRDGLPEVHCRHALSVLATGRAPAGRVTWLLVSQMSVCSTVTIQLCRTEQRRPTANGSSSAAC